MMHGFSFSGFSVGFCINEEEGYLLPTIARKNDLWTFRLNAPVVIRAKVKQLLIRIGSVVPVLCHLHSRFAFPLVVALQRKRALLDSVVHT